MYMSRPLTKLNIFWKDEEEDGYEDDHLSVADPLNQVCYEIILYLLNIMKHVLYFYSSISLYRLIWQNILPSFL